MFPKERCKCCLLKTIDKGETGFYDVCSNWGLENDPIQNDDPNNKGGANRMSLNEAKETHKKGLPIE